MVRTRGERAVPRVGFVRGRRVPHQARADLVVERGEGRQGAQELSRYIRTLGGRVKAVCRRRSNSRTSWIPRACVCMCHGTPQLIGGEREGVGCEGCHNPGGKWKPYHSNNSKPENYRHISRYGDGGPQAEIRRRGSRSAPIATCWTGSRRYDALTGDGHPDGRKWNVGVKYAGVSKHWKPETAALYTAEKVIARARIDRGGGVSALPPDRKPQPAEKPRRRPKNRLQSDPKSRASPTRRSRGDRQDRRPRTGQADTGRTGQTDAAESPRRRLPSTRSAPEHDAGDCLSLSLPTPPPTTASEILAALQSRVAGYLTRLFERRCHSSTAAQSIAGAGADLEPRRRTAATTGRGPGARSRGLEPAGQTCAKAARQVT